MPKMRPPQRLKDVKKIITSNMSVGRNLRFGPAGLLYLHAVCDDVDGMRSYHLVFEHVQDKIVIISSKPNDEFQEIIDQNNDIKILSTVDRFLSS